MGFSNFISAFVNQKSGIYDPSSHSFNQLDPTKISQQMRLAEIGKQRGENNLPPSSATMADDIEQKITLLIRNEAREAKEVCDSNFKVLISRLKNLATQPKVNELATIADKAETDFSLQIHQTGFALYLSRLNVTKTEQELEEFKKKHSLTRMANYPKSRFKGYAILFLLVVIETILNGYFFSKKNDLGWLGGVSVSSFLSIANISIGIFLGNFAYRFFHHRRKSIKFLGAIICTLCMAVIITVNLGIAHYRTLMNEPVAVPTLVEKPLEEAGNTDNQEDSQITPEVNLAELAFSNFKNKPLGINDIESWLLVLIGVLFSLTASYKAYRSDDPYFRYGEVARRRETAIFDYGEMATAMLDDLQDLYNHIKEHLDNIQKDISSARGESLSIKSSFISWNSLLSNHLNHLEDTARILISEYRYSNMSTRTEDAPKFFKKDWELEKPNFDEFVSEFDNETKGIEEAVSSSQGIYTNAARQIRDAYEVARKAYQTIEDLQPEQIKPEEFQKWLTEEIGEDGSRKLAAVA